MMVHDLPKWAMPFVDSINDSFVPLMSLPASTYMVAPSFKVGGDCLFEAGHPRLHLQLEIEQVKEPTFPTVVSANPLVFLSLTKVHRFSGRDENFPADAVSIHVFVSTRQYMEK